MLCSHKSGDHLEQRPAFYRIALATTEIKTSDGCIAISGYATVRSEHGERHWQHRESNQRYECTRIE